MRPSTLTNTAWSGRNADDRAVRVVAQVERGEQVEIGERPAGAADRRPGLALAPFRVERDQRLARRRRQLRRQPARGREHQGAEAVDVVVEPRRGAGEVAGVARRAHVGDQGREGRFVGQVPAVPLRQCGGDARQHLRAPRGRSTPRVSSAPIGSDEGREQEEEERRTSAADLSCSVRRLRRS